MKSTVLNIDPDAPGESYIANSLQVEVLVEWASIIRDKNNVTQPLVALFLYSSLPIYHCTLIAT